MSCLPLGELTKTKIHSQVNQSIMLMWQKKLLNLASSHLQIVNQKSPEVAAASKQHIAMGFEDTAFDEDAAITEEVPLALLIELKQQFGHVAWHFHDYTSVSPARETERESRKDRETII